MALVVACGSDDSAPPPGDNTAFTSDPNKTVVLGGPASNGDASAAAGAQATANCVTLPTGECVDAKACESGERRDVVVDSAGKVLAVVCYPASATPPVVEATGDVNLDKTANNGVVAIDGASDGVDVAGDVTAASNNVVVYGEGADVSVIGGSVTSDGNNFALRGVTVKKDVRVTANNATLVLCRIEGNVTLEGNNNVIANCSIAGNVEIHGVNNVLANNQIGGNVAIDDSKNTVCEANVVWNDANGNFVFDATESGAAIVCEDAKKK